MKLATTYKSSLVLLIALALAACSNNQGGLRLRRSDVINKFEKADYKFEIKETIDGTPYAVGEHKEKSSNPGFMTITLRGPASNLDSIELFGHIPYSYPSLTTNPVLANEELKLMKLKMAFLGLQILSALKIVGARDDEKLDWIYDRLVDSIDEGEVSSVEGGKLVKFHVNKEYRFVTITIESPAVSAMQ
jgi:hypothetical protein